MRRFNITVNGSTYEVEVEEVEEEVGNDKLAKKPAAKNNSRKYAVSKENSGVTAPMPGVITDIRVKVGDEISDGQMLMILEAMKMENEIASGKEGVIKEIVVSSGQTVAAGDLLLVIE